MIHLHGGVPAVTGRMRDDVDSVRERCMALTDEEVSGVALRASWEMVRGGGPLPQMFNLRVMQEGIYGALKQPGRLDLKKLWGQIGTEGVPPSDLTRQKFKDMVFEWYYAEQNKRWSGFRDETMLQVETLLQRLQQLEPTTNIRPAYMEKARELYREARALDDAYMAKKGEQAVMMPIQDLVQKAVADGNNSNAIRYLAQRYGIGTPNGKLRKYYDD